MTRVIKEAKENFVQEHKTQEDERKPQKSAAPSQPAKSQQEKEPQPAAH
jgi:hypothetical protein